MNTINRDPLSVSFKEGNSITTTTAATATTTATATATATTTTKAKSAKCKQGSSPIPFPRGGRRIGETYIPSQQYTSPQKALSRSNSGEPQKYEQGNQSIYLSTLLPSHIYHYSRSTRCPKRQEKTSSLWPLYKEEK
jgi:hypothetical protein